MGMEDEIYPLKIKHKELEHALSAENDKINPDFRIITQIKKENFCYRMNWHALTPKISD